MQTKLCDACGLTIQPADDQQELVLPAGAEFQRVVLDLHAGCTPSAVAAVATLRKAVVATWPGLTGEHLEVTVGYAVRDAIRRAREGLVAAVLDPETVSSHGDPAALGTSPLDQALVRTGLDLEHHATTWPTGEPANGAGRG